MSEGKFAKLIGRSLAKLKKRVGVGVEYIRIFEWKRGRVHAHVWLRTEADVTAEVVSGILPPEVRFSCKPRRGSITAAARYLFKAIRKAEEKTQLPPQDFRGKLFVASRGFFVRPIKALWKEVKTEWRAKALRRELRTRISSVEPTAEQDVPRPTVESPTVLNALIPHPVTVLVGTIAPGVCPVVPAWPLAPLDAAAMGWPKVRQRGPLERWPIAGERHPLNTISVVRGDPNRGLLERSRMAAASAYQFSGHETFPFRYTWLKKGFDAVVENGSVFLRDDSTTTLGVGKNMVRSIRHWCLSAGILEGGEEEGLRPSALGELLFANDGLDPYLEDPASLWLLHWQLATNRYRCATWFWAFSHFHEPEFARDALVSNLLHWTQTLPGKQVAESSLRRDVEVFLRTYVPSRLKRGDVAEDSLDCPLIELGLLSQPAGGSSYWFRKGRQDTLPDGVLLFAVLTFWDATTPDANTFAVADLARLPGSPGRVFKIDESSLVERLEQVEAMTGGVVTFNETAGLRQLYRHDRMSPRDALESAYAIGGRR
jgi:hypothetical protein